MEHIVSPREILGTPRDETLKRPDSRVDLFMALEMGKSSKLLLAVYGLQ
jgi:hypothetical protein